MGLEKMKNNDQDHTPLMNIVLRTTCIDNLIVTLSVIFKYDIFPLSNIILCVPLLRVRYHYSRDHITIVSLLRRHQKSIVAPKAERRTSEWDTGTMCKLCCVRNEIMYVLSWRTAFALTRVLYLWLFVYFPRCLAAPEINTKITLSCSSTRVHTLFFI